MSKESKIVWEFFNTAFPSVNTLFDINESGRQYPVMAITRGMRMQFEASPIMTQRPASVSDLTSWFASRSRRMV